MRIYSLSSLTCVRLQTDIFVPTFCTCWSKLYHTWRYPASGLRTATRYHLNTTGLQKVRKSLTMTILLYVTIWLYTSLAGLCAVDPSFKSWQIGSIAGKTFVQIKSISQGLKKDTMGSDGIPWTNLLKDLQRL